MLFFVENYVFNRYSILSKPICDSLFEQLTSTLFLLYMLLTFVTIMLCTYMFIICLFFRLDMCHICVFNFSELG